MRVELGNYPTPVERFAIMADREPIWIKRDDQTSPIYGGNKVRKLERILGRAVELGAKRILTIGAVGSHHVLATTIFARQLGLDVHAALVPQPRTEHVVLNIRAGIAFGLHVHPSRSWATVPFSLLAAYGADSFLIPVGGSDLDGTLAYVDAARELAAQVRAGVLPEPDAVFVTLGSGGTAAGLAAGFAIERMKTRVVAILVSDPMPVIQMIATQLARRAMYAAGDHHTALLGDRWIWERRFRGRAYGYPTPEGTRAMEAASEIGITLDSTYTAKTFAAVLDAVNARTYRNILYWHTLSSAPFAPLLEKAPEEKELPESVRALFADAL